MEPVAFHFDNVHAGLSQCAGLLHLTREGMIVEFRTDLGGLGLKSSAKETSLQYEEIRRIEFRKGFFGASAKVIPSRLKVLERFPGAKEDCVMFRFKRRDRTAAEYLISELNLRLSQKRLGEAGEGLEGV